MKRLFQVRDASGSLVVNIHGGAYCFDNKQEAKKLRNVLGKGCYVTLGPDHRRYIIEGVGNHAC